MIELPKRNSLVHQAADTLKKWISTGMLKEVLPGELDLKERLRVGRDTLRLALEILMKEGWLEPSTQGQKRRIRVQKTSTLEQSADAGLPVTILSPYHLDFGETSLEMEDTRKRLAVLGRELNHVSPEIFHLKHPGQRLESLVRTHPSAAWILHASSSPIQKWFSRQGLPTLVHGWPYPDVNLPYVTKDWEPAGFHAGLQLIRSGHRTVAMFEYVERGAGAMLIERGLRRALETAESSARLLLFKDERTPQSVARAYEAAFSLKNRPTAMVLTSSNHLLTSLSWLISKGIHVPNDVSLMVLPYDTWYSEFYPPICHYRTNTKSFSHGIAERVLELVEYGRVSRKSLEVPVEFVTGASTGPPPTHGMTA